LTVFGPIFLQETLMSRPPPPPPLAHYDDLDLTLAEAWGLIGRGVADRKCAFHTPAVATAGLDGRPRLRTVVLRGADGTGRWVQFHTDRRSAKYGELGRDPRLSMLFYDAGWKVQIRLEGTANLLDGDAAGADAWAKTRAMSRICYAQAAAPGSPVADPAAATIASTDGDSFGIENFIAVRIAVHSLDWLYLAHAGHRRALFTFNGPALRSQTWLAP
jgi:pyridoxamine 5'-phosphate oxidase